MKANEAPEKIYMHRLLTEDGESIMRRCAFQRDDMHTVEYTRTDAFIEKALAYLNSKFYFHNVFYGVVSTDFNAMEELFEDFKKYMEGE